MCDSAAQTRLCWALTGGTDLTLEGGDFGLGGVLAERAEELSEGLAGNLPSALLVEERKGLAVLWKTLVRQRLLIVCAKDTHQRCWERTACQRPQDFSQLTIFTTAKRLGKRRQV